MKLKHKLMSALEDSTPDIKPLENNAMNVTDDEVAPDTVTNSINDAVVQVEVVEDNNEAIEDAEDINEALSNMVDALEPAVTSGDGIEPHEAEIISVATEMLKGRLGYNKGKKTIPAMESFGGSMSKVEATKLALEGLTELVSEVNVELSKSYTLTYSDEVKVIESIISSRKELLSTLASTAIKAKEFFKTSTYANASSFVGNELVGGEYVKNIFNVKDMIDGKMPVVSVLSGIQAFKLNNSINANISKLTDNQSTLDTFLNANDWSNTSIKNLFNSFREAFDNINKDGVITVDDSNHYLYRKCRYPLGNYVVMTKSISKEYFEKENYWRGDVDIEKEVTETGKLLAMSDQETITLIDAATEIIQNNELGDIVANYISKAIEYRKASDYRVRTTEQVSDSSSIEVSDSQYITASAYMTILYYIRKLSIIELRVIKSINDYVLDSIGYLATRETPQ